ncbi:hypothetical protein BKA70DRAFT_1223280 [Coprinopsis sp. MPI-PUGE-AT-0042]|nr:hypothetical protein BKA70DRAFT_1223280 [Coprinopsis sp. MPI-PUGE-AT-0042]
MQFLLNKIFVTTLMSIYGFWGGVWSTIFHLRRMGPAFLTLCSGMEEIPATLVSVLVSDCRSVTGFSVVYLVGRSGATFHFLFELFTQSNYHDLDRWLHVDPMRGWAVDLGWGPISSPFLESAQDLQWYLWGKIVGVSSTLLANVSGLGAVISLVAGCSTR